MTTIPQLMGEIAELERDVEYYKNRYERIRNEKFKTDEKFFTDYGFTNIEQLSIAYNDYKSKIDKAISLYLKELSEKGKVDDLACIMFNVLEGNIKW